MCGDVARTFSLEKRKIGAIAPIFYDFISIKGSIFQRLLSCRLICTLMADQLGFLNP